jgi:hypothetical protein
MKVSATAILTCFKESLSKFETLKNKKPCEKFFRQKS